MAAAFARQGEFCRLFAAPFTGLVCDAAIIALDGRSATGRRVAAWPGEPMADALMMRFTGALNLLVRDGRAPALQPLYPPAVLPGVASLAAGIGATLADPALDQAVQVFLDSPPQTNEVARAGVLFAGVMAAVAACGGLPVRLFELGASAGLNLNMDRFGYQLGGVTAGDPTSPVQLAPQWEGPPPALARVQVQQRSGVDINPLDVSDASVRARLLAFVWPDQPERVVRAQAAIGLAQAQPPPLVQGDAADWAETHVRSQKGSLAVVYHSIAHQYFSFETQTRLAVHMAAMGAATRADAPLAWLRYEMDDPAVPQLPSLRLTLWQGGEPEERLLARAHPHGASVAWLGQGGLA